MTNTLTEGIKIAEELKKSIRMSKVAQICYMVTTTRANCNLMETVIYDENAETSFTEALYKLAAVANIPVDTTNLKELAQMWVNLSILNFAIHADAKAELKAMAEKKFDEYYDSVVENCNDAYNCWVWEANKEYEAEKAKAERTLLSLLRA